MSELNKKIDSYIQDNPRQPDEVGYYNQVAQLFSTNPEHIRNRCRRLRKCSPTQCNFMQSEPCKPSDYIIYTNTDDIQCEGDTFKFDYSTGTGYIQASTTEEIASLEDLIRVCKIDTDKYDVVSYEVKAYNAWIKNLSKEIEKKQLYSVKASLKIKKTDTDLSKQKDVLLEEIRKESKPYKAPEYKTLRHEKDYNTYALEISIPDLHIGKLAWAKETGEDYDIKEAVSRYKEAFFTLISRVDIDSVERIILPIGNDMINVDSKFNLTTAGTPVSCDSRFGKMFQTAKALLIETIQTISDSIKVDVIVIPGNHDTHSMFTLGEVLDAWFHNDDRVTVYNQPTQRKYYQYGSTGLMFTHGNEEKHQELGMIFAAEQPQLWAATKFRFCKLGHFHKTKKLNFVSVDEHQGFQVEIIPSLSGTDAWHNQKGYNSLKGAKAYLYHKEQGRIAEYSHYI